MAFLQLIKQIVIACGDHAIYFVPGALAEIPIMYIPMINCTRVIAKKKTTTRFFPRVSAYKLLDR